MSTIEDREEQHEIEAIELIDAYLITTGHRELISASEVQDLLLDIRLSLEPCPT